MTRRLEWFSVDPLMLAICGFSFVIRVIYRIHAGEPDFWINGYIFFYKYAVNIVAGKGMWAEGLGSAARPPIYPCFLALAAWAGGAICGSFCRRRCSARRRWHSLILSENGYSGSAPRSFRQR